MASQAWHPEVSAMDRYEVIRKIHEKGPPMNDAIAIEQQAYHEASSKQDYETRCLEGSSRATNIATSTSQVNDERYSHPTQPETGIRIGKYTNCKPIADGITSEVYSSRSISPNPQAVALKVIVTNQNIEPHNPQREIRILWDIQDSAASEDDNHCIPLLESFRDQEQRLVLVFPEMPYTLADLLARPEGLPRASIRSIARDILKGLDQIHEMHGIIHRDIKPSAILLKSPTGPALLSDFGTAWHPDLSSQSEHPNNKILDIGTGPYRAPECLFGHEAYTSSVDIWSFGVMLTEMLSQPPHRPIFESRAAHEDGNQLGLILSIFKTLGTPRREDWTEAEGFKVQPFELWTVFEGKSWEELLPGVDEEWRELVKSCVKFEHRVTAEQALQLSCLKDGS